MESDLDTETSFFYLGINKNCVLGYTVMLLYNHILTLDNEIDLIWQRRFMLPTYLFFIFCYATPLVSTLNLTVEHDSAWMGTCCS
jgi:hypothetical protein